MNSAHARPTASPRVVGMTRRQPHQKAKSIYMQMKEPRTSANCVCAARHRARSCLSPRDLLHWHRPCLLLARGSTREGIARWHHSAGGPPESAPCAKAFDHANRPPRIGFSPRDGRDGRQSNSTGRQTKELPAEEFHALPSRKWRHRMPTPMALVMRNNDVFSN
jgi:hypothetical protein